MTRTVKPPAVRREELIDAAEKLFLKKGFEETPVSEIVEKAQVAQGTFYYYFQSKAEALDAIACRYLDIMKKLFEQEIHQDSSAIEKLTKIFQKIAAFSRDRKQLIYYLHEEKNALLHLKMEKKTASILSPFITKIIEQGINEGVFHTPYPHESAVLIIDSWGSIFDEKHFYAQPIKERTRVIKAGFYLMEKILGAKEGSLSEPFLQVL